MKDLYTLAKNLYLHAFPGEDPAFADALFALGFPQHLEGLADGGELISMLFALPYPIRTETGELPAHYLYAVATDAAHRGKGYAKKLLSQLIAQGTPLFLRPMSPSLFDFYRSVGFKPFSPYREECGDAAGELAGISHLTRAEYLTARDGFLRPPYCRMTPEFLSLSFSIGGAVGAPERFAALFERDGDTVLFKEFWGDPALAPAAAHFLGAARYTVRFPDPDGTPFAVGVNIPENTVFLAALD